MVIMPLEWAIEKAYGRIRECPVCGSNEGFWANYGISNSYIQCKHCGVKTQLYQTTTLSEETARKLRDRWLSTAGFFTGIVGLALFAVGLVLSITAAFPPLWLAVTILGITVFAAGLIITFMTENGEKPSALGTLVSKPP